MTEYKGSILDIDNFFSNKLSVFSCLGADSMKLRMLEKQRDLQKKKLAEEKEKIA